MSIVNPRFERSARALAQGATVSILVTALLAACETDRTTELLSPSVRASAAKGAPQGGGGSGTLTVTAANPPQATQDTTLDVNVIGTGFTNGARAVWALNGDTTLVHVKSTKRVSDTQLVASLIVPANAPTASYDIQVYLVGGKKGVGAELFTVTLQDPSVQVQFPLDDAALGLRSDHIPTYVQGNVSVYADAVCGVHALMFYTNGGDVTMQTNDSKFGDRHCPDYPRQLGIVLRDDAGNVVTQYSSGGIINTRSVEATTNQIPIGSMSARSLIWGVDSRCNSLRWTLVLADQVTPTGANQVNVTRVDARTWHVQTQPYPNDKALCLNDNRLYHVPVDFTIVADRPMP